MSRVRYNIASRRLHEILGTAREEEFFALSWATHAFQNGREEAASRYFRFPPNAVGDLFDCKWPVFPWAIETLLNELLVAPKRPLTWPPLQKNFDGIRRAFNALCDLEGAAYQLLPSEARGVVGLGRVVQRQFEWQRGDISLPQLVRAHFLYGGERYGSAFEQKHGVTVSQFTFCCFAFFLIAQKQPFFGVPRALPILDLESDVITRVVNLLSMTLDEARSAASLEREVPEADPSYRPSVFRHHPLIRFGELYAAPLPALIVSRSTSGLFYDLAGAEGGIRNEVSGRFEAYCSRLLSSMLASMRTLPEFSYRLLGQNWVSPDVVMIEGDSSIRVIVECKATRMPVPARFAAQPHIDDARGYAELARGITQIWRFASHCRHGSPGGMGRHDDLAGLLITLDSWLTMAGGIADEVFALAHRLADEDPGISPSDRIHVNFVSIEDLELLLAMSTDEQFFETLAAASAIEFKHWLLPNVRRQIAPALTKQRDYGLKDTVSDLVPWWRAIERL